MTTTTYSTTYSTYLPSSPPPPPSSNSHNIQFPPAAATLSDRAAGPGTPSTRGPPPPVPPKPAMSLFGRGRSVTVADVERMRLAHDDGGRPAPAPALGQLDDHGARPRKPSPGSKFASQFASLPGKLSPRKGGAVPPRKVLEIGSPSASSHVFAPPSPAPAPALDHPPPPSHYSTIATRPRTSSSPHFSTLALTATARPPLPRAATVLAAKFQNSTNLKDRLVAGAGLSKEWGLKSKGRLEERWKQSAAASTVLASSSSDRPPPSPLGALDNPIKLPATILGVKVPKRTGVAFGVQLKDVVEATRIPDDALHRKKDTDEITGDDARKWLPAIALRCLEYLEEWGRKEEGIYRVPGSSYQIAQLRALFDAGMDLDLREIHPGDLDPHAVASFFKSWLRELPDSLLTSSLSPAIDILVTSSTGHSAISTHFLGQQPPASPTSDRRELLEQLRELFGGALPAEEFYLLRALAYHLARLASHAEKNKMTLSNLRLILSPTLRLSPVMLAILVEDREILFSKINDSARLREASLQLNSFQSHSPASTLSHTPSIQRSPLLNPSATPLSVPSPTLPHSGSWQMIDVDPSTIRPLPPSPLRTPIADRFAGTSPTPSLSSFPSSTPSPSPTTTAFPSPTLPPPKPFIPSRAPNGGTRFTSRQVLVPAPALERARTLTMQEAMAEQRLKSSNSPLPEPQEEERLAWSDDDDDDDERPRRSSESRSSGPKSARPSSEASPRPSFETGSSSSKSVARSVSSSSASARLSAFFGSRNFGDKERERKREKVEERSRPPPSLTLPVGLGLGIGAGSDEDGWGLLSVDERRKFFGG